MAIVRNKWVWIIGVVVLLAGGFFAWNSGKGEAEQQIVYVYSDSCGYCNSFAPTFEKVSNEFTSEHPEWKVERLDIQQQKQLEKAQAMGAEATPTVFVVHRGEVVDKLEGEVPEKTLRKFLTLNAEQLLRNDEKSNN